MALFKDIQEKYKESPTGAISAAIGTITAVIGIIIALNSGFQWAGQFIVTPTDLQELEQRITEKFTDEAVTIRTTYIADLTEQKAKLNKLLLEAETVGEVAVYQMQIKALDERIKILRGDTK